MARIRTIKPEFFTSEDICALSPLARLFFQACWCEADREGRMEWKPRTMKLRYFPADNCDIDAMAAEVVERGLVTPYEVAGKQYAEVTAFTKHQSVNPRESVSKIPARPRAGEDLTRADASNSDLHAQRGREGKGKEGNNPPTPPSDEPDASDDADWIDGLGSVDRILVAVWMQTGATKDDCLKWLTSTKGQGRDKVTAWLKLGPSVDDLAAKITAAFDEAEHRGQPIQQAWPYLDKVIKAWAAEQKRADQPTVTAQTPWHNRIASFRDNGTWLTSWGPKPNERGCHAPQQVLAEFGYPSERAA
jgi:hypothetical protein